MAQVPYPTPLVPDALPSIPTRLYPTDCMPMQVMCADTNKLYGITGGGTSFSSCTEGGVVTAGLASTAGFLDIQGSPIQSGTGYDGAVITGAGFLDNAWSFADNVVFAIFKGGVVTDAGGATGRRRYLFKSVDGGVNFGNNAPAYNNLRACLRVGDLDGTHHSTDVSILSRGMIKATLSGAPVLLVAEYNANTLRTSGAANDQLRVWKSADNGDTWTAIMTWNTSGHQVRHLHCVLQDPYDGKIYVGCGDTSAESGIIQWNGVTAWTNNSTLLQIKALSGFNAITAPSGSQSKSYPCTDLIFDKDWIYAPVDSGQGSANIDVGIYRFDRAMTMYQKVDSQMPQLFYHCGYWGLKHSSGTLVVCELVESTNLDERNIYLYTSANGVTWYRSGVIRPIAGTTINMAPTSMFEWRGRIYMGMSGSWAFTTKGAYQTPVFTPIGKFIETEPETLHPVHWTAPNGVDDTSAGRGSCPALPWATIKYPANNALLTFGARLIAAAGVYADSTIAPSFATTGSAGIVGAPVTLEGAGKSLTSVFNVTGTDGYALYFGLTAGHFFSLIKDLAIALGRNAGGATLSQGINFVGASAEFRRCTLGRKDYSPFNNAVVLHGKLKFNQCVLAASDAVTNSGYNTTNVSVQADAEAVLVGCLVDGGNDGIYYAGTNLTLYNNTVVNYKSYGVHVDTTAVNIPTGKNNLFYSPGATLAYVDIKPFTYTSDTIGFNIFDKATSPAGIATSQNNQALVTNPKFNNFAGGNYSLQVSSSAVGAGRYLGVSNINNVMQSNNTRPNIGAY